MGDPRIVPAVDAASLGPAVGRAGELLRGGAVVAHPTETVYGLAVDPWDAQAVGRLIALKGRREGSGFILILDSPAQASGLIEPRDPVAFRALTAAFWPGPLTLVGPPGPGAPGPVLAGTGGIALRATPDPVARALVAAAGRPLTSTSANRSGQAPAVTAEEVAAIFPEGLGMILDGGPRGDRPPSTVLDLSGPAPRLLREGAIAAERLEALLGMRIPRPGGSAAGA